ncbi:hypothetical protein ILUMI_13212 [Ignelater luminosus]|uniref:Alpha-(1,6)-fucosyltransferase n=1 Tax=Ignelater luminosus TaxID=2038154 RepID=A0A8K0D189_IGNLU|nr:hypothetical protein ILUMI_13212 [Ignelater luminosus]
MNVILRQINSLGWNRMLALLLLFWIIVLLFTIIPMLTTHVSTSTDIKTTERLTRALEDLDILRKQNLELQEILRGISSTNLKADQQEALENFQNRLIKAERSIYNDDVGYVVQKEDPSTQYEILRRRISNNIQELWYFINSEVLKLQRQVNDAAPELLPSLKHILDLGVQHKRWLLRDMDKLAEADGYATWREKEANELDNLVQTRFHYLQNPPDCKKAKKLVCNLNKGCGYGCQLHHVVYCFMVAYGTQRTLILKSKGWRYHKGGWEEVFKPISETCTDPEGESSSNWPGNSHTQVLTLPIIDSISPRPPFLPLSIPEDLAPRLIRLHGDPIVWWVGQFLKYLLRPQEKTAALIQNAIANLGFRRPIVGVHVRRTDKVGTEASYHGIEEYMSAVDEYYNQLELKEKVDKRRIYLATDDPKVITDARNKYPHYEILGDATISKTAAVSTRYSDTSLQGIILDIHMLSMSDFLVCTFSSQVCRIAYEIMQNYFPDASAKFRSLDDVYYYGGQSAHNRIAVMAHDSHRSGEIQLMPGDLVGIAGNHWNGYSKGRNLRTNQIGLFPSFKVKDKVETAKFPTYSEMYNNQNGEES